MSYSIKLEKLAREKQRSREIVSEIIIAKTIKKYRETINKEEDTDNNVTDDNKPKIILE